MRVGDEINEKGEAIAEWRQCIDKSHGGVPYNFYITEREKNFYISTIDQATGEALKLPRRCYPCRVRIRNEKMNVS